jgi:hypothetical protein
MNKPSSLPHIVGVFVIGNWYQTLGGEWIKLAGASSEGTEFATVYCEEGIHRYTHVSRGIGRVTGSTHPGDGEPDSRNLIVPTDKVLAWPNLVAPPMYENPAEGWTDPAIPDIRAIWEAAREVGYAVGVHGSLKRDFDLIAAPWTESAVSNYEFVKHLCTRLNYSLMSGPEVKPHGRVAVCLQPKGWVKVIDLSIVPRLL